MADITAADVKQLRDATGAGMMAARRPWEADGDHDKAAELLRIKGETKVKERGAERTATNGLVAAADGALIQLNCETDFVAKNEQFQQLAADIVSHAAKTGTGDVAALLGETLADGRTVAENIDVGRRRHRREARAHGRRRARRRAARRHLHAPPGPDLPPQVGVLVEFEGWDLEAARGRAMQIAAMRPHYVTRDEVPADVVENERRIAEATAREEGKPEQALTKIVEGRVNGFFKDVALLEQPSVQDNKKTVKAVLDEAGVTVKRFARFEVGAADRPTGRLQEAGDGAQRPQSSDEEAAIVQGSTEGTGKVAAFAASGADGAGEPERRYRRVRAQALRRGVRRRQARRRPGRRGRPSPGRSPTSCRSGVQVAIVVGGGNFFRGAELSQSGMDRPAPTTWACSARS